MKFIILIVLTSVSCLPRDSSYSEESTFLRNSDTIEGSSPSPTPPTLKMLCDGFDCTKYLSGLRHAPFCDDVPDCSSLQLCMQCLQLEEAKTLHEVEERTHVALSGLQPLVAIAILFTTSFILYMLAKLSLNVKRFLPLLPHIRRRSATPEARELDHQVLVEDI